MGLQKGWEEVEGCEEKENGRWRSEVEEENGTSLRRETETCKGKSTAGYNTETQVVAR